MDLSDCIDVCIEPAVKRTKLEEEAPTKDPLEALDDLLKTNVGHENHPKSIFNREKSEAGLDKTSLLLKSLHHVDIGGLYWLNFDNEDSKNQAMKEGHFDSLTVVPRGNPLSMQASKPIKILYENPKKKCLLGVPRFWGLAKFGKPHETLDHRKMGLSIEVPTFVGSLRPMQEKCLVQAEACLQKQGGTTIIADCGFGKTATAIRIALQMKRPTLILCNREILMIQWLSAIRQFSSTQEIGWIQGSLFDKGPPGTTRPKDWTLNATSSFGPGTSFAKMPFFSVGSIVSFGECSQDRFFLSQFGMVVIDEMHHIAAPSLVHVVPTLPSAFIVGLTATPNRSDGLEDVLQWLTGPTSFVYQRLPSITGQSGTVQVQSIVFKEGLQKEIMYKNGTLGYAQMLTYLTEDTQRQRCLESLMKSLQDLREKIIVVTSHVAHAKALFDFAEKTWGPLEVAIMAGPFQMPKEAKDRASTRIVLATYSLLEEGYDDPSLDALLLAMPRSKIQQTIGRIERHKEGKQVPVVFDLVDDFSLFPNMHRKRMSFYKSRGFACTSLDWTTFERT